MLSLHYYLHSLLLVSILRGVSCEDLTALQREEFSPEGSSVTLSYRYSKQAAGGDQFYWYRQYRGEPPEFIISHLGTGHIMNNLIPGLKIKVESNQIKSEHLLCCSDRLCCVLLCCEAHSDRKHQHSVQKHQLTH
ncbi:hypothetical protein JOQ06_022896 [Pogonophryne albipinna]|uniref:Immunoglobulin V-set domain-containing protein n=1 Tax=Pogonophryne albipinna TaxID=1090488 RepID=A0AAD6AC19_9TELE|nr:hypothetical protein JOQ06_022896 [Pogonophryne albipinna]